MFIAYFAALAATPKATAIDPASWFSSDDYPLEAVKQGVQGSVTFEVDVDAAGKPTACRIAVSSGSPILDQRTCEIVSEKGQFKPAVGPGGRPVAGRYSNRAIWKMPNMTQAAYRAGIIDFSGDPDNPVCTIQSKGPEIGGFSCEQMIRQVQAMKGLGTRLIKLVYLVSQAPGDAVPYRGEPDWGVRLSYLASDVYYLKGSYPSACVAVAAEGMSARIDPCSAFPGVGTLSQADKKKAIRTRTEISLFALLPPASRSGN